MQQKIQDIYHFPADNTTQLKHGSSTHQQSGIHLEKCLDSSSIPRHFTHLPLIETQVSLGFWLRVERPTSIKHVKSDWERADIHIVRNSKNCKHATDRHHFPWPESKLLHLSSRSGQVHGHHQELSSEMDKVAAKACCKERMLMLTFFFQRQALKLEWASCAQHEHSRQIKSEVVLF